VDVHPVEAGVDRAAGARRERLHGLGDLILGGGRHRPPGERVRHRRRRERLDGRNARLAAGVGDLREHQAVGAVNRLDQPT
jgi:hypothetical protein